MNEISTYQRLKKMPSQQRISYIWYYYKIHIFSILALLVVITSFSYSQLTSQEIYFNITYVGNPMNADELSYVNDRLNKLVLKENSKKVINIDPIFMDNSSSNSNSQYAQKLMVQIAAKEIDMAIVNKEFFETNYPSNMFLNLEVLEGFSSLPISSKNVIKKEDSNGNSATYGITVTSLRLLNDVHFPSDDYILVVISNSEKTDRALEVLKSFINK